MRFGLFGGASRAPQQTGDSQSYHQFIDYVVEAEQLGFESVFLVEHHFTGAGQVSASLTLLAYLAGLTSTMRLGTAVTVMPWHNPVLLAEQAATVDLASNGRLDFGIGKGYRANEFHGFCISPDEAQARFEESVELLLKSWTIRERFSHHGAYWNFKDVVVEPFPVQDPHPPVWVAAQSEYSVRGAAKLDRHMLLDQFSPPAAIEEKLGWYRDELATRGKQPQPGSVALTRGLLMTETDDPAAREAELDKRLAAIQMLLDTAKIPGSTEKAASPGGPMMASREANEAASIVGGPEECIQRLKDLEAAGVDYVLLNDPWGGIERLRLFAREVLPEFA